MRIPKNILICGSREANAKMLDMARLLTLRAWHAGHTVIVGDACGVDAKVVEVAERFCVDYRCYGISQKARNGAQRYVNVSGRIDYSVYPHAVFYQRDRIMVAEADIVCCVWNEASMGTYRVYEFAVQSGKAAYLYNGIKLIEKFEPEAKGSNGNQD